MKVGVVNLVGIVRDRHVGIGRVDCMNEQLPVLSNCQ